LCKHCLAVEPADRPADAAAVADQVAALRRAADERAKQAELTAARAEVQAAEQRKRRRVVLIAGRALAAVLAAGVVGTTIGLVRADRARKEEAAARGEAEGRRVEADEARRRAEAKQAETAAVLGFFEKKVLAAARPKDQEGGLGWDVKL